MGMYVQYIRVFARSCDSCALTRSPGTAGAVLLTTNVLVYQLIPSFVLLCEIGPDLRAADLRYNGIAFKHQLVGSIRYSSETACLASDFSRKLMKKNREVVTLFSCWPLFVRAPAVETDGVGQSAVRS